MANAEIEHLQWGLLVEGFGDETLAWLGDDQILISTASSTAPSGAVYVESVKKGARKIKTECEPLDGLTTMGSIEFEIDGLDSPYVFKKQYGNELLKFFRITSPLADLMLSPSANPSISKTQTTITGDLLAGGVPPLAGDILFVGREAMLVTGVGGVSPAFVLTVERGIFSSEAQTHDQSEPFFYLNNNPLPTDRRADLILFDHRDGSESTIFKGVVEEASTTSGDRTMILSVIDLFGMITNQDLGADRWSSSVNVSEARTSETSSGFAIIVDPLDAGSPVPYVPIYGAHPNGITGAIAVEIEGSAFLLRTGTAGEIPGRQGWYQHNVQTAYATQIDPTYLDVGNVGDLKSYTAREILVTGEGTLFRDASGNPTDHPADLIRCLISSTGTATGFPTFNQGDAGGFDRLPKPWALGIEGLAVDGPAFDKLVQRWPTGGDGGAGLHAKSFYLGSGENESPAGDAIFNLAQAMGCYLYLKPDGSISINHLSDPGPAGIDHEITDDDIFPGRDIDVGEAPVDLVQAIKLLIGERGPGGDATQEIHAGDLGILGLKKFKYSAKKDELESTKIYGDRMTGKLSIDEMAALLSALKNRYVYSNIRLPKYTLELMPGVPVVKAGQWVSLSVSDIFDQKAKRGISKHRCMVISGDEDKDTYRQVVCVVDWAPASPATTSVAPSWRISSVISSSKFAIELTRFGDNDGEHIRIDPDAKYLLYSPTGKLLSTDGPEPMSAFTSPNLVLSAPWKAGGLPITPTARDIIGVADYDDRGSWEDLLFAITYIANSDAKLGAANDPAALWGS